VKRKKLLRVRPFNMANFSGAGGYIPMYAMYGIIVSLPAMLLLWTGFAVSTKTDDGKTNLAALKRKLLIITCSVGILTLIGSVSMVIAQTSFYGGNVVAYMLAIAILLGVGIVGACMSIFYPAKRLSESNRLTKGKWFLMTLGLSVLTLLAEITVFMGIMAVTSLFP